MKIVNRFFLLCMLILLAGCGAKTTVAVIDETAIGHENIHIVFVGDEVNDPLDVGNLLAEAFTKHGVSAEVQNAKKATQQLGSGSGLVIAEGYWLTNNHVIKNLDTITVSVAGADYPAELVAVDKYLDLALLKGPTGNLRPFALGEAQLGEEIFVIGYPIPDILGSRARVTSGLISSLHGYKGDSKNIQISAPIQPGNSGGPVVTEDWKLAGVAVSTASTMETANRTGALPQGLNFAVSPNHIKGFLLQNGVKAEGETVSSLSDAVASSGLVWNGDFNKRKRNYLAQYTYHYYWDLGHHLRSLSIVMMDSFSQEIILKSHTKAMTMGVEGPVKRAAHEMLVKLGLVLPEATPKKVK